ncbi:hypothetical protein ACJMK2_012799 [Sinanodonta woodiana]|uniref:E3 ubiquitin-protein ligase RNF25 n=1 Tax=Sinanodonta woodiana TaxID=1069815 RepID=A0ABD3V9L9_SINWO
MAASSDSGVLEELEVLEAIYLDDLNISRDESGLVQSISLVLHPATGDDVHKKFVCMTLVIQIPEQYPNDLPTVTVRNPRGIGDEDIQSLLEAIDKRMEERKGESMLFEVIELAKESLTEGNIPQCSCVICMEHFQEGTSFTKTHCYHYFHNHCLARYAHHCQKAQEQEIRKITLHTEKEETKVHCPMCREDITHEILNLEKDIFNKMEEVEEEVHIQPSEELRKWQKEMDAIRQRQAERGGIIDVEANRNKFLLTEDDMRIMLPVQSEYKDEKERKDTQTDSIRTGRQASDGYRRGRGRSTEGKRHGNRNRDREDFGYREYRGAGRDAGAHAIERGRGRYFRADNEKYDRNNGYKHDGRDKTSRKGDNVNQGNNRSRDSKEKDVQYSRTQSQGNHSSDVVDHEIHKKLPCKKDEVNGLKEVDGIAESNEKAGSDRKSEDFLNRHESRAMDSGYQDENDMRTRGSGNQDRKREDFLNRHEGRVMDSGYQDENDMRTRGSGNKDRKREDCDKNESEAGSRKIVDQHVNCDQQEYHGNNSRIKDLRKENITINGERGKPLSGSKIENKDTSPLQHERNTDEKSHLERNLKDRPYSGSGRYGKCDTKNRQNNRPYSGYSRGSKSRYIAGNKTGEPFSRNNKGRPTSGDINKRSAPTDGKEKPSSGDGEIKPSAGDDKESMILGDGNDGAAVRDGKERSALGESEDNTNKPSSQHNSNSKNRPPSKFESVKKDRPLEEHGKRNELSNRTYSGHGRYEKGRFYSRHNKKDNSDQLSNYEGKRIRVKSERDHAGNDIKANAFKRDFVEVQAKDHIENNDLSKENIKGERKMGERGSFIRDKSGGNRYMQKSEVLTEDCYKKQDPHIESHVKESNHKMSKHDLGAARNGDSTEEGKVTLYPYYGVASDKTWANSNQESVDRLQGQESIHQQKPPGFVLKPPPGIFGKKEHGKINPVDQALDSDQQT